MTAEEAAAFAAKEKELSGEKEKRRIDEAADAQAEVPLAKKTKTEVVA